MPIFDDVPLSDGEEEALLHLNVQGETTGVKDEAAPHLEACPLVTGDDVGLSHVDDLLDSNDMLMAVMQTDMMELENTGEPAMDDFQEHFHAAVNSESGVLAFYIPSVNVMEPGVVSQLLAAIEAGDRKLRLKLETGPHPPIRGMNPIKKFCRKHVWSDDENRLFHVEFLRTQNKRSYSVTDLYHCVWFFDNKYKNKEDSKEKKEYIKKVQKRGTHDERKVAILDSDIVHYCTGKYKLPKSLVEKPILVLKKTAFTKALNEVKPKPKPKSKKRKLEIALREIKRVKCQVREL